MAIKYFNLTEKFTDELCFQDIAHKYHLAPKIYGYCTEQKQAIMVMDYVRGFSFRDLILSGHSDIIEIYLNIVWHVVYQNQIAKIIHGDLHYKNVYISKNIITFIDYGNSQVYPEAKDFQEVYDLGVDGLRSYWSLAIRFFQDLYMISSSFINLENKTDPTIHNMAEVLKIYDLIAMKGWFDLYASFYGQQHRLPDPDEVVELLRIIFSEYYDPNSV